MSIPRFVELRACEADPCGRIRIEFDDDRDILQISDEDTLPEMVGDANARRVKPIGTICLNPDSVRWVRDQMIALCEHLKAHGR